MLGDIDTRRVHISEPTARVYPNRDNVTEFVVSQRDGRQLTRLDFSAVTRFVLVLRSSSITFAFDTAVTAGVVTGTDQGRVTFDLSSFDMPDAEYKVALVAYDAEHLSGQVVFDGRVDSEAAISLRTVSGAGTTPPPGFEYVSEAPIDGELYGRKDGAWSLISEAVAGVVSVNGQVGVVVLDAADVGADAAGTAAAAIVVHKDDTTPHLTLLNLTKVAFNTAAAASAGNAGEVVWNNTDMTLDIGIGGGVTLQAGQELQVRGLNNSGSTMLNGQAVFISGASGNRLVFSKAQANQSTADKTIAVLTQDILNNQQGQATVIGLVRDLNTSGFAEGVDLWLSSTVPGGLTATKPPPPDNAVRIGYVVRSHATLGSIFVRIQNIEQLDELHNLNIINPLDGDIIEYDSATSTWINVPNTGGAGEANTASNLGTGVGIFASKVVADLQFKSLIAGTNITLTPTATGITIDATGGGGGAVDSVNGQTGVVVLVTDDIAEDGAPTNLWFTNARASAAAPVQTVDGQTGAVSLSASYAPLSHVGDTGAAHGNATTSVAGFMSAADKTKLDGVAVGATANSTDAALRDRTTHTGVQAISTITNLQTTLDGKQATLVSGTNIKTVNGSTLLGSGDLVVTPVVTTQAASSTAGALDLSATTAPVILVTLTENITSITMPAGVAGQSVERRIAFTQDGTGGRTVTGWGSVVIDGGGSAPAVNATAGATTNYVLANDNNVEWRMYIDASAGNSAAPIKTVAGTTYTLELADAGYFIEFTSATAVTVTVPPQSGVVFTGTEEYYLCQAGAGQVTVVGDVGVTVVKPATVNLATAEQEAIMTLKRRASDSWRAFGLMELV